MIQGTFHAQ
jgi:succinyl-CoA synthetase alpha subunit